MKVEKAFFHSTKIIELTFIHTGTATAGEDCLGRVRSSKLHSVLRPDTVTITQAAHCVILKSATYIDYNVFGAP